MDTRTEEKVREQARADGITHISTGVAVFRSGKILMVRRAADDFLGGYYELPGGGVDKGETIENAALREVSEETGLHPVRIITTFQGFDYSTDKKPKVRQINFVVEAGTGNVTLSQEHDDFAWVSPDDLATIKTTDSMRVCMSDAFAAAGSVE